MEDNELVPNETIVTHSLSKNAALMMYMKQSDTAEYDMESHIIYMDVQSNSSSDVLQLSWLRESVEANNLVMKDNHIVHSYTQVSNVVVLFMAMAWTLGKEIIAAFTVEDSKTTTKLCETCMKNKAADEHTCPFEVGMNNDFEFKCTCCKNCQDGCRRDI